MVTVTRDDNYWRYWATGRLFSLSNLARIYVLVGKDPNGATHEIHIAFDNWPPSKGELQVLRELQVPEDVQTR